MLEIPSESSILLAEGQRILVVKTSTKGKIFDLFSDPQESMKRIFKFMKNYIKID